MPVQGPRSNTAGGPPEAWLEEQAFGGDAEVYTRFVCRTTADTVVTLSYFPDALAQMGVTLDTLREELAGGVSPECIPVAEAKEFYRLTTSKLILTINPRPGKKTGLPLMCLTKVSRHQGSKMAGGELITSFALREIWDEVPSDLGAVCRHFQFERKRWQERRATLLDAAGRTLRQPRQSADAVRWQALHSDARRQYGPLYSMIDLLGQRTRTEGAAEAEGIVEMPPATAGDETAPPLFTVRITRRNGHFEEGARVVLDTARGDYLPMRIEDITGERFSFRRVGRCSRLATGEPVKLNLVPRFHLDSHLQALDRFFDAKTEGDWADLVHLVTAPGKLKMDGAPPMPQRWFAEEDGVTKLNDEQKNAVAGALGTPHAFFIQGPPGTGKTTVIAEVIQHLVRRGERVLMLAPTHVAVDEVLRRVGDRGGVRALRLAWNEALVSESVRKYTPSQVRQLLAGKLRTPGDSRAEAWRQRREDLVALVARDDAVAAACRQKLDADLNASTAQTALETHTARSAEQEAQGEAQAQETATRLQASETRLTTLKPREEAERRNAQERRRNATLMTKVAAFFRRGELAAAETSWKRVQRELADAETEKNRFESERNQARIDLATAVRDATSQADLLGQQFAQAESVRAAMQATWLAVAPVDAEASEARLGRLRSQRVRFLKQIESLEAYPGLESEWFETSRRSDAEGHSGPERLAKEIGDDLLKTTNLFCSTTTGIANNPFTRAETFDTLIVDEASRVTDAEFLIGAVRARRWILVGDEKQLPPYVDTADEYHLHALAAIHRAGSQADKPDALAAAVSELSQLWEEEEEAHQFRDQSVIARAEELIRAGHWHGAYRKPFEEQYARLARHHEDADRAFLEAMRKFLVRSLFERCVAQCDAAMRQRLVVQRRMIEPLARIVAQSVYQGDYRSPERADLERAKVTPLTISTFRKPVTFIDTHRHGERAFDKPVETGFVAMLEAEWIVRACEDFERELHERDLDAITVSVLCFYRAQAKEIKRRLGWPGFNRFHKLRFQVIDAIDKIQGQESDLVLLSFGRVHGAVKRQRFGQWLQDLRRLNVACTRAHRAMVFVGHRPTLEGLHATPAARAFYTGFFELLTKSDEMEIIENYGGSAPREPA